jgi:putative DNA primase/helicase
MEKNMASSKRKTTQLLPRCTDLGNAELFAALHRNQLRFDHARMRWLLWGVHWWAEDTDGELMRKAKKAVRYRLTESEIAGDEEQRENQAKWAIKSESLPRLHAMVNLARSERPIADDGTGWDQEPWILGVENGVVDLRTGKLRAGDVADKTTLHTNVAFDPGASCPRWDRFLLEIFGGNLELVAYVNRAIGYSLTGDTSEQCFFCCHGEGANGKSTFLNAVRFVMGSYSCNLPFSAFELQARSTIPNDVATIPGRRFITAIETDEAARLNESRIKALTGGDAVTARLLNREFFTFKPVGKFWLAFNHQPTVADDSHGFWRRVRLIPFIHQFKPGAEPELQNVLRSEARGILAWAVRGCLEWQALGLNPPADVKAATEAYRLESDPFQDFIADRCVIHPDAEISVAALWDEYMAWVTQNRERNPLSRAAFGRRLKALGVRKARSGHDRTRSWAGICRVQDAEAQHLPGTADITTNADTKIQ